MREQFLHRYPPGLAPEALAKWRHVSSSFEVDEAQFVLVDVDPGEDGCALLRQLWCFDEEDLEWVLESNDEWWLPWDASVSLASALLQAVTVGEAK